MTREEFIETFGQDPVDVIGSDWENDLNEMTLEEMITEDY